MRTGLDLKEDEIRSSTPDPLTQHMFLSQTVGFYDPIGLASPAKQKGMMLIRDSYQEAERVSPEELSESSVWQEGPAFLKMPESDCQQRNHLRCCRD